MIKSQYGPSVRTGRTITAYFCEIKQHYKFKALTLDIMVTADDSNDPYDHCHYVT